MTTPEPTDLTAALRFTNTRLVCRCGASVALSNWDNHAISRRHDDDPAEAVEVAGIHSAEAIQAPLTETESALLDELEDANDALRRMQSQTARPIVLSTAAAAAVEQLTHDMEAEGEREGHSCYRGFAMRMREIVALTVEGPTAEMARKRLRAEQDGAK